jgi:nucleoid DNA-binding protein
MDKEFNQVFMEALRGLVTEGKSVAISGFGTFKPLHQKQYEAENEKGEKVLMPPKDTVEFIPEAR